jgi:hypothetical protein
VGTTSNGGGGRSSFKLRPDAVLWREVDGEIVALSLHSSTYLRVNPSGTYLWTFLVEGTTEADLIAALVGTYGVDDDRARHEVDRFLTSCAKHGILEPDGS